jgi:uncharacterized protein YbjT (DUF2867 family)
MFRKIAVIGATGMLGKPVAQQLIHDGFDLTVLARNTTNAKEAFPMVNVLEADVLDPISLLKSLEGQEAVYISLSPNRNSRKSDRMPEREGISNIIDAAKHLGIKRIALLSSLVHNYQGMNGFSWWIFEMKQQAVELIKKSGIPYSIFYPSTFMESIPRDIIRGNKIMLVSGSVAPMWFIGATDYAKQVSKAFSIAGNNNQEYPIQGLEAFDWEQAASIIAKNYKKPLKLIKAPSGMLKFLGNFVQSMNYAYHICEALNKYPEKFESEKTWKDLGMPSVRLADFIKSL